MESLKKNPVCGAMGAAIASLFTQFFTNVILGFIIRPIRKNNELMLRSLNPKIWGETVKLTIRCKHKK